MRDQRFESIFQVAYVVADIDAAVTHWARVLGVGPFFVVRRQRYAECVYRGQPTDPEVSLAFAYSGDLNIELVQLHDEAPSVFRDFVTAHGYGLQHVGCFADDIAQASKDLAAAGVRELQRNVSTAGVETRFFDTELHPGAQLELIAATPELRGRFAAMKAAAETWDGRGETA